jgi:two-component system, response regulator, stage 0 sporulation protein F
MQRRARVVVADDDDDSRELLVSGLRRDGFEVHEARDGIELIGRVAALRSRGHVIHAVVSDIGMPNCDGLRATRSLRSTSRVLPIVLITGFDDVELRQDALEAGATAVIQKPVRTSELTGTIMDALALTPPRRGASD